MTQLLSSDVHIGHLYAQYWDPGWHMALIRDETNLVAYNPIRICDIADFSAKHLNAIHEYELVPRYMRDKWMDGVRMMSYCFGSHSNTDEFYACLVQKQSGGDQWRWTFLDSGVAENGLSVST